MLELAPAARVIPAALLRANALHLPLADESVDLIVTSPPYFALRSYRDAGEHYDGQIGSEPTPQAFLEALWAVMAELWRVLKPAGVCFVNLGDKRSGSGGHNNASLVAPGNKHAKVARGHIDAGGVVDPGRRRSSAEFDREALRSRLDATPPNRASRATRRNAPDHYNRAAFGRAKSKMLLPHRFAIGCEDGLADPAGVGWIVRQDLVWSKPNGLPESVTDRTRDAHEYWFMLTKEGRYFSAMDEIREPHTGGTNPGRRDGGAPPGGQLERLVAGRRGGTIGATNPAMSHPRGRMPGSVWSVPSEGLQVPKHLDVDHFAAFPTEWPRRLILGWSPAGICVECGDGRRPVTITEQEAVHRPRPNDRPARQSLGGATGNGFNGAGYPVTTSCTTITGEACRCPSPAAPTRPAVVLDPFGGTGTTAAVARAAGRLGVSVDLSADYLRLARWRIEESGDGERAIFGARPPRQIEGQLDLLAP